MSASSTYKSDNRKMSVAEKNKNPRKKCAKKSKKSDGIFSSPDDEELKYLEKIVLGTGSEVINDIESEDSDEESTRKRKEPEQKQPAWVDDDDDFTFNEVIENQKRRCTPGLKGFRKYQIVTQEKYEQVMGVPKWSKKSAAEKKPRDDLLNKCGKYIKKKKFLQKNEIEYRTLNLLNSETHIEGPIINVVKFHPKSTVAMVAGQSGIVSLFQVGGQENTKLQSIQFPKYPIFCGSFIKNGEEFIIGSQHYKYFYTHNMITGQSTKVDNSKVSDITKTKKFCVSPNDEIIAVCGNSGKIYLFATSTKEYIDHLQMNCNVSALDFNQNGDLLYSHGEDGEIYIWDMKSRTCVKKFYDDGCLAGTSIAVSGNDEFIASGSSSGVVNIYNSEKVHSGENLFPIKTVFNLVTPITSLKFNSSCEILALASDHKFNGLKLLHTPSMTVFSNFPSFQSKVKKPMCLDFSPNSGYFAIGDSAGCAYLFRLKYYGNY